MRWSIGVDNAKCGYLVGSAVSICNGSNVMHNLRYTWSSLPKQVSQGTSYH